MPSDPQDLGRTEQSLCAAVEPWEAEVAAVPATMLKCSLRAISDVHIADGLGSKLNGALWRGLADAAKRNANPLLRYQTRCLSDLHDSPRVVNGLQERVFVLRLASQALALSADSTWDVQIVLFGLAAEYWPGVVAALSEVCLDKQRLQMTDLRVLTDNRWQRMAQLTSPHDGVQTLRALAAYFPLPDTQAFRIQFISPVLIQMGDEMVTSFASLEPLVVALLAALSSVALQRPGPDLALGLRRLAASVPVIDSRVTLAEPLMHRSLHRGVQYSVPGIVGLLDLPYIPQPLLGLLSLGRFTHLGKASAFGMGRYDIARVPDTTSH